MTKKQRIKSKINIILIFLLILLPAKITAQEEQPQTHYLDSIKKKLLASMEFHAIYFNGNFQQMVDFAYSNTCYKPCDLALPCCLENKSKGVLLLNINLFDGNPMFIDKKGERNQNINWGQFLTAYELTIKHNMYLWKGGERYMRDITDNSNTPDINSLVCTYLKGIYYKNVELNLTNLPDMIKYFDK